MGYKSSILWPRSLVPVWTPLNCLLFDRYLEKKKNTELEYQNSTCSCTFSRAVCHARFASSFHPHLVVSDVPVSFTGQVEQRALVVVERHDNACPPSRPRAKTKRETMSKLPRGPVQDKQNNKTTTLSYSKYSYNKQQWLCGTRTLTGYDTRGD